MKGQNAKLLMVAAVCAVLAQGCTGYGGRRFAWESRDKIVAEQSTMEDVRQLLGEPLSVNQTESGEVWEYAFAKSVAIPFSIRPPETSVWSLIVKFGRGRFVTDSQYAERHGIIGTPTAAKYNCPQCGAMTTGPFCSKCGARLETAPPN